MIEAERANIHLRLDPENTYTIRITLLLGELFPLFHEALMHFMRIEQTSGTLPFIQIGKQAFTLDSIIAGPLEGSGWVGSISLANLVKEASMLRMGKVLSLNMEFTSLTTFNRSNKRSQIYGRHSALLPLPAYLFPGLARRWQEIAPPELASLVQIERIEQYIADDGIIISDYNLQPHQVHFTTHLQPGFVGQCTYDLRGPEEQGTEDAPLMVRQQIWLLARLASYCGVGYKTAMGLGQACLLWHKGACDL
jgi:CRISPR-associated endoribonuclease Cas6